MSDLFLFLIGTLVTLIVAAAVTLLMWGAANEPRHGEGEPGEDSFVPFPEDRRTRPTLTPVPAPVPSGSPRAERWKQSI